MGAKYNFFFYNFYLAKWRKFKYYYSIWRKLSAEKVKKCRK